MPSFSDELTTTVFGAIQALPSSRKADFLLDTALGLIDAGQYGDQVESYLEVYLKTPGLRKENVSKALLARGKARKSAGEKLVAKAHQGPCGVLTTIVRSMSSRLPGGDELGPGKPRDTSASATRTTSSSFCCIKY